MLCPHTPEGYAYILRRILCPVKLFVLYPVVRAATTPQVATLFGAQLTPLGYMQENAPANLTGVPWVLGRCLATQDHSGVASTLNV